MTAPTTLDPNSWQQPLTPLEYSIPNPYTKAEEGANHTFWYRVVFIRPTANGYQLIGQHGAIWDARAVVVRVATTTP